MVAFAKLGIALLPLVMLPAGAEVHERLQGMIVAVEVPEIEMSSQAWQFHAPERTWVAPHVSSPPLALGCLRDVVIPPVEPVPEIVADLEATRRYNTNMRSVMGIGPFRSLHIMSLR